MASSKSFTWAYKEPRPDRSDKAPLQALKQQRICNMCSHVTCTDDANFAYQCHSLPSPRINGANVPRVSRTAAHH